MHQLGVVQRTQSIEYVEVLGEEGGDGGPVVPVRLGCQLRQAGRLQAHLPAAGEHPANLLGESAGAQACAQLQGPGDRVELGTTRQEVADHDVLLRRGEQAYRWGAWLGVPVGSDEGVAEGVERPRGRRRHRDAQPRGDPLA